MGHTRAQAKGQGQGQGQGHARQGTLRALSVLEQPSSDIKEDYTLGTREEVLGRGGWRRCARACRRSGRRFACKSIHKDRLQVRTLSSSSSRALSRCHQTTALQNTLPCFSMLPHYCTVLTAVRGTVPSP